MPNWCENEVDIDGSQEEIQAFTDAFFTKVKEDVYFLDFHKVAPLGLPVNPDGTPGWDYETAMHKWTVKWDLNHDEDSYFYQFFSKGDNNGVNYGSLNARFDTAWGPPERIYDIMTEWIEEHKSDITLTWFYKEPNMFSAGWLGHD